MARFIDADRLRDEVFDCLNWNTANEYNMYSDVLDMIDYAPTEDVQPVVHGKWDEMPYTILNEQCWMCSCCDTEFATAEGGLGWDYCPNCGARMDGDKNG